MSAYNVTAATINRVVNLLEPSSDYMGNRLGRKLQAMNAEAVAWRYNEPPEEPYPYKYSKIKYSKLEMEKAGHCYLYQCMEGDVPEKDLYARVAEACNYHESILTAEYDALPWDFPDMAACKP